MIGDMKTVNGKNAWSLATSSMNLMQMLCCAQRAISKNVLAVGRKVEMQQLAWSGRLHHSDQRNLMLQSCSILFRGCLLVLQ